MPIALDVNPAFAEWKSSTGREKEWAFHTLIQRMERFATAVCCQRLPEHQSEYEALVNGIVWRAIKKIENFREASKFSTWFYTIIVNEANRFLRNYKERCEVALEDNFPSAGNLDARVDLIALLNTLEGPDHALLRLVAEGQDFKTIAGSLGISRNAALVRWTRLKERLRDAV